MANPTIPPPTIATSVFCILKCDSHCHSAGQARWVIPRTIAQLLLKRISVFSTDRNLKVIVLVHTGKKLSSEQIARVESVLSHTDTDHLTVLNLLPKLSKIQSEQPKEFYRLFGKFHMNAAGNEFVAREVYNTIRK